MDNALTRFNTTLLEIETKLETSRSLKKSARDEEVRSLETRLTSLENDIAQFQMRNPHRYNNEINELESKTMEVRSAIDSLKYQNDRSLTPDMSQVPQPKTTENRQILDQALVHRGDQGLAEAKAIALSLVKTAEKMREEVNMIDDEVMLQKEKLIRINRQIKETQDVTLQTQKLVRFVTLTVNQDVFIKVMIGLVTLMLVAVLAMAVFIRVRQSRQEATFNQVKVEKYQFDQLEVNPQGFLKVQRGTYANEWLAAKLQEEDFYLWGRMGLIGRDEGTGSSAGKLGTLPSTAKNSI
jgi:intracellular septation protein A